MPTNTTRRDLPVPIGADDPSQLRLSITAIADAVDGDLTYSSGTLAARPSASSSLTPRIYFATDTGLYYFDTGSAWQMIFDGAWQNLTISSGWTSHGAQARLEGDVVRLRGAVQNSTGSAANGTYATCPGTFPAAPTAGCNLPTMVINWSTGTFVSNAVTFVNPANALDLISGSVPNGDSVSLDGVTYHLAT